MDYTERLIEEYLHEDYISQAADTEGARATAARFFKTELTNGPKQWVKFANGAEYPVAVGTFDLTNFHKAYDAELEKQNLLTLFDADGKLINKNSYGELKKFDKTIPAIKYTLKLWGVQFGNDPVKFLDGISDVQAKANLKQKVKQFVKDVEAGVENALNSNENWNTLKELNFNSFLEKEHVRELSLNWEEYLDNWESGSINIGFVLSGLILPPGESKWGYGYFIKKNINVNTDTPQDIINWFINELNERSPEFVRKATAIHFAVTNYEMFLRRPEVKDRAVFSTVIYYKDGKFYSTKLVKFESGYSKYETGLILVDMDTGKNTTEEITPKFKLVATTTESDRSNSSNTYYTCSVDIYYNTEFGKDILDKLGVEPDYKGGSGQVDYGENTNLTKKPEAKYFKKCFSSRFEIDSSD